MFDLKMFWCSFDEIQRGKATDILEWELGELENIFSIIVMGQFIGFPAPPPQITFELLPYMEDNLHIMISKVGTAHDPLGELFSVLDID